MSYKLPEILPHDHPMILLSEFIHADDVSAVCQVDITKESHFFDSHTLSVPSYVGIEYMAQTIAAYAGVKALKANQEVQVGFLLGSRKYNPKVSSFKLDQKLQIFASKLYDDDSGLSVFECHINIDEKEVVSARVNVFQPESADKEK